MNKICQQQFNFLKFYQDEFSECTDKKLASMPYLNFFMADNCATLKLYFITYLGKQGIHQLGSRCGSAVKW
jgi:hypothetical protein